MNRWMFAIAIAGCACPQSAVKPGGAGAGTGSAEVGGAGAGAGSASAVVAACEAVRAKVEALYRAEATEREPKRVDEATADNTAMVMRDCALAPATRPACLAKASTIAELEQTCLAPLDDEGAAR